MLIYTDLSVFLAGGTMPHSPPETPKISAIKKKIKSDNAFTDQIEEFLATNKPKQRSKSTAFAGRFFYLSLVTSH